MYCEIQNETEEGATCAELPRLITKSESETTNLLRCTTTCTTIDTSVLPQLLSTIVNVQLVDVNYHVLLAYIISNFHCSIQKYRQKISFFEMEWYFIFVGFLRAPQLLLATFKPTVLYHLLLPKALIVYADYNHNRFSKSNFSLKWFNIRIFFPNF